MLDKFLYLKKNDGDTLNDRIPFFAEKGDIIINTRLATFESSAKISGSNNHIIWQEYKDMMRKFDDRNLKIINDYINNVQFNVKLKWNKLLQMM